LFDNINKAKHKRDNDYKYRKCNKETSVKILTMKLSGLQGFEKNVALADIDFCTDRMYHKI